MNVLTVKDFTQELAQLRDQKPIGYAYEHQDYVGSVIGEKGEYGTAEVPLYAAPGAMP